MVVERRSDNHKLCDSFNIQNRKNYAMFSICEYYFHMQIKLTLIYNQNLADVQRRGNSVCIMKQPKSRRCSDVRSVYAAVNKGHEAREELIELWTRTQC